MYGECHGHIFMDGVNYCQASALHACGVNQEDVRRKLEAYQKLGISFFRDGGDALGVSEYARSIAPEYGIDYRTPIYAIHKNGHYGKIVGFGFDDLKEYHRLVLGVKARQGDFIKVMFSGIMDFKTDGRITGIPLEREEIREMIHIAHEEGFAVMAHVNGARTVQAAVECGVDSVEHGNFMDEECLQALAENQAVWVPTLVTVSNLLGSGRFRDQVIEQLQRQQERSLRSAFRKGVKVALGSDAGAFRVLHGQGLLDEYRQFQRILKDVPDLEKELAGAEAEIRSRFCRSQASGNSFPGC
ncbi:MAG: amidohydrolase family protein [Lachnospiraceae bacterium]|nr:amidohydrolase family protein [Lachnospiraceae bacterium]